MAHPFNSVLNYFLNRISMIVLKYEFVNKFNSLQTKTPANKNSRRSINQSRIRTSRLRRLRYSQKRKYLSKWRGYFFVVKNYKMLSIWIGRCKIAEQCIYAWEARVWAFYSSQIFHSNQSPMAWDHLQISGQMRRALISWVAVTMRKCQREERATDHW